MRIIVFIISCLLFITATFSDAIKVVVTGAGGRTGSLVFQKLIKSDQYSPVAIVRTKKSRDSIVKKFGCDKDSVLVADVTNPEELEKVMVSIKPEKVILCTSAVPQINYFSLAKSLVFKVFKKVVRPTFTFPNGDPYNVDWLGAKYQIDSARKAGVKQFVFLSSMGGTQPDNFLNTIGKKEGDDRSGDILLWKRKAEEYLVKSKIGYTIIHPGGLLDKPAGEREILLGVDDKFLAGTVRSIPRGDVAEVCVQALGQRGALNRAIDIVSKEPGAGAVTSDWKKFFEQRGNCKY